MKWFYDEDQMNLTSNLILNLTFTNLITKGKAPLHFPYMTLITLQTCPPNSVALVSTPPPPYQLQWSQGRLIHDHVEFSGGIRRGLCHCWRIEIQLILATCQRVSTFFHPANRPIDFVKSFLFGFFKFFRLGLELRLGVRVGVGFGLVT